MQCNALCWVEIDGTLHYLIFYERMKWDNNETGCDIMWWDVTWYDVLLHNITSSHKFILMFHGPALYGDASWLKWYYALLIWHQHGQDRTEFLFNWHMKSNLLFDWSCHADWPFFLYCVCDLQATKSEILSDVATFTSGTTSRHTHIHRHTHAHTYPHTCIHTHRHIYIHTHTQTSYSIPGLSWLPPPLLVGTQNIALQLHSSILILNTHLPTHAITQSGTTSP